MSVAVNRERRRYGIRSVVLMATGYYRLDCAFNELTWRIDTAGYR